MRALCSLVLVATVSFLGTDALHLADAPDPEALVKGSAVTGESIHGLLAFTNGSISVQATERPDRYQFVTCRPSPPATATVPGRDEWPDRDELQLNGSTSIRISEWSGRAGNNIRQLRNAILMAQVMGKASVELPEGNSFLDGIFDLPKAVRIKPTPKFVGRVQCTYVENGTFAGTCKGHLCDGITHHDRSRALREYMTPLLNADARAACQREASQRRRELVVHLRSGDLLRKKHFQSKFAPCSFFSALIRDYKFENVRIVTESDRQHPCLGALIERHGDLNITIQNGTLAEDACTLMHASYLAIGSHSSFSEEFGIPMNSRSVQFFSPFGAKVPEPGSCHAREKGKGAPAACPAGKGTEYCVPGIDKVREAFERTRYMLRVPSSKIVFDACRPFLF